MAQDPFSDPTTASGARVTDFEGRLLLLTPIEYREEVETEYGEKDCVEANIVVLDEKDPTASERHDSILLFQGQLIGQTKAKVGKGLVLGRLGKGEPKKKGHNPPWRLLDPEEADRVVARAYLTSVAPEL